MIPSWMLALFTTQQLANIAVKVLEKIVVIFIQRLELELADNRPLPELAREYIALENANNPALEGKDKLKNSVVNFIKGSLRGVGKHSLEVGGDTITASGAALKAGIYALWTAVFMAEQVK